MSVYRTGSIRGKAVEEATPALFRKLGRALAERLENRGTVVVGGDVRPSTPDLKAALIQGLEAGGCVIADVGVVPGPLAAFAGRMLRSDAVAMVTGEHHGADENGLVLSLTGPGAVTDEIGKLRDLAEGPDLPDQDGGEVESWEGDILDEYLAWLSGAILPVDKGQPMSVVMDVGNGAVAQAASQALEGREGVSLEMMFEEPDGTFPGRGPDGSAAGALDALAARVREVGAAVGVAFDASGVRVRFVDEKGQLLAADAAAIVLMRHLRAGIVGRNVVVDARAAGCVLDEVKKVGGKAVLERGEPGILCARTAREQAAMGVSIEGVYAYDELKGDADGLYTALRVVEMLRGGTEPLSKLSADVPPIHRIRDVHVACDPEGVHAILNRIRAGFPGEAQTEIGGIRVRVDDGWAAALTCEAEPGITFSFGAKDEEALARVATEMLNMAPEVRDEARRLAGLPELPPTDPYAYLDERDL